MFLTLDEIRLLMDLLTWKPVYEDRRVRLAEKVPGYREDDKAVMQLQAKLSIMGEAASKRGA